MTDEYWLSMLREIFTGILESVESLDTNLPPEGFQDLDAIKFDAKLGKQIVEDMIKDL
jgi:hypothetical protein